MWYLYLSDTPVSQRDTACRVTCTFSANCSCESPCLVRSSRRISLGSISITTLPELYHDGNKKPSNCLLLRFCLTFPSAEQVLSSNRQRYPPAEIHFSGRFPVCELSQSHAGCRSRNRDPQTHRQFLQSDESIRCLPGSRLISWDGRITVSPMPPGKSSLSFAVRDGLGIWRFRRLSLLVLPLLFCP